VGVVMQRFQTHPTRGHCACKQGGATLATSTHCPPHLAIRRHGSQEVAARRKCDVRQLRPACPLQRHDAARQLVDIALRLPHNSGVQNIVATPGGPSHACRRQTG